MGWDPKRIPHEGTGDREVVKDVGQSWQETLATSCDLVLVLVLVRPGDSN